MSSAAPSPPPSPAGRRPGTTQRERRRPAAAPDAAPASCGGAAMTLVYDIHRRTLADRNTAVCRGEMPPRALPGWLASAFHAVGDYLNRTGVEPTGPPFARFTFLNDVVAVEAGYPVSEEIAGADPVEPSALPDGPAAVATHTGRYEDLDSAYAA